ncbi:MAG: STAS domain-containing protein [Acidimicrobiales bacterium]
MTESALDFAVEVDGQPPVIRVTGEIDFAASHEFATSVERFLSSGTSDPVVFDLAGVTFMDSSGLAVLISTANAGHAVVIRNPSRNVRSIVDATGLQAIFQVQP